MNKLFRRGKDAYSGEFITLELAPKAHSLLVKLLLCRIILFKIVLTCSLYF